VMGVAFPQLPDISKLERYVALVIKFNPETGERPIPLFEIAPGQFSKKPEFKPGQPHRTDFGLFCMSLWQDLKRGIEMRLVMDDRDISQYRGVSGVEVIEGKDAINAKVKELFKPRHAIVNSELFRESLRALLEAGKVTLDELAPLTPEDQLKLLFERGCLGIREEEPFLLP